MTVRVFIPGCPDAGLSPNSRKHWRTVAKLKKEAKQTAAYCAHYGMWESGKDDGPFAGPVAVRLTIGWGKGRKRMDADNALACAKAYVDGLNGVVWEDDKQCTFLPVIQERDPEGRGYVVVEIAQ